MKYTVAVVVLVIVAVIFIGDGYLKTRRAEHSASTRRTSLSSMSIQELSSLSEDCDLPPERRQSVKHDSAYCAEVWREIEARPFQAVEIGSKPVAPR
jgi:hypothetical protein